MPLVVEILVEVLPLVLKLLVRHADLAGVGKKLQKWRETLIAIEAVLSDAEKKQLTSEAVKLWLNDLKHFAYDIEDLLNTFSIEMLDRQVRGFFTYLPLLVIFNFTMDSEIKVIANRLQDIFDRKEKLGLRYIEHTSSSTSTPSSQRPPSSSVLDGPVVGRDEDKRKIVELLSADVSSSTNKYQVVAIVGMGGLGKTTLAGQVYDDVVAMQKFDLKIWVSVSDDFNLEKVTRTICQKLSCDGSDLSQLQENLRKAINGKRFLIVLDDVWSTCDYDSCTKLQAPFHGGAQGSKVMVTTREEKVAALMGASAAAVYCLKTLSDENCLQLFEQHLNSKRPPNFELLKKKILTNCKGLPLAAKTLGGVLRCKDPKKWEEILNDKLWSISDESKILPVLRLSYHHLPSPLKRCFAYCSILPNDYEFGKILIINLWMAEGFLEQQQGSRAMEDIGDEYFEELLSRSFFQKLGKDDSRYVMHDLLGDLARWAAGDTFARLENKSLAECSLNTRHMAYIPSKFDGRERFESVSNAKHLRTFLPLSASNMSENYLTRYATSEILLKLKYLRVLSFKGYKLTEVPDSIGVLRHLRYLNFCQTLIECLPESICTLYNLQTLILDNCLKLKTLPSNLSSLSNLRHICNFNTPSLEEMPPQVGQLAHLQTLSHFVVGEGSSASGIGEIGSLNLRGYLSIGRLENVTDVGDAQRAQITTKEGLDFLQLEWSGTSKKESEVLCSLEPHKKILELKIKGYCGLEFSQWIGHPSFSVMTSVTLENCKNSQFLPPLGQLPFLKTLWIERLSTVESVGAEFYGECGLPFPALESLLIKDMPVWKEWLLCKRVEEIQVFPCLQVLEISKCPKLKALLPNNIDSLSEFLVFKCEELVVSIANYKHLVKLVIDGCKRVVQRSVVKFELLDHMELYSIPEFILEIDGFIRGLTKLQWLLISDIDGGNISKPLCSHFIQHLRSLVKLEIIGCSNLICFPECDLPPSLRYLKIESCNSLTYFVRVHLPRSIRELDIAKCENLKLLVKDYEEQEGCPPSSCCLEILDIKECASLTSLSGERGRLPGTLREFEITDCRKLESIIKTFHEDTCLQYIRIQGCENLKSLPEKLCRLSILHTLIVRECGSLISFPRGGLPSNLRALIIGYCVNLEALPRGMNKLTSLHILRLVSSGDLSSILEEGFPPNLIGLLIDNPKSCKPLSEWGLHQLHRLVSLKELWIAGVDRDMVSFPPKEVLLPKSLIQLYIGDFPNLKRLSSSFQSLTSLESLSLECCPKLESVIPEQADHLPHSLTQLRIFEGCPLLTKGYKLGKGRDWSKIAHIPYVYVGDWRDEDKADKVTLICVIKVIPQLVSCPEDIELILPNSLIRLHIASFPSLRRLSRMTLQSLTYLEYLVIVDCSKPAASIPEKCLPGELTLQSLVSPGSIRTEECLKLASITRGGSTCLHFHNSISLIVLCKRREQTRESTTLAVNMPHSLHTNWTVHTKRLVTGIRSVLPRFAGVKAPTTSAWF